MNLVNKIKIFTIMFLLLIIFNNPIFAANAENSTSNTNYACELFFNYQGKTKLAVGEKAEIEIDVKNINIQNGIAMYNGTIQYDNEKIEMQVVNSEEWEVYYQKNNNITLVRKDLENVKDDQIIGKIILTAKTDIDISNISLKNGEVTDGEKVYKVKDISLINIEYSTKDITNKNVIVKIKSEKNLEKIEGWILSADRKILTKEYENNIEEYVKIKYTDGENITVKIKITNIDKESPEIKGVKEGEIYTSSVKPEIIDRNLENIELTKDGVIIEYNNKEIISEEGNYRIKATDVVGNVTVVNFMIKKELNIINIVITKPPNKTSYIEGENFEKEGMKVIAIYNNETTKELEDYTILEGNNLKIGQTKVIISYTEGEINKTVEQEIKVETCNHLWNEGEKIIEPSCIDKGTIVFKCTKCGKIKEEEILPLGHKYENDACIRCGQRIFKEGSKYYTEQLKIRGIKINTSIKECIDNINTKYKVTIRKQGKIITEGKVGTGMTVQILDGEKEIGNYTAIIKGDTNGDGEANIKDMVKINNYRLFGTITNFDEIYQEAADVNNDKKINIKDMIRINNYRLYGTEL